MNVYSLAPSNPSATATDATTATVKWNNPEQGLTDLTGKLTFSIDGTVKKDLPLKGADVKAGDITKIVSELSADVTYDVEVCLINADLLASCATKAKLPMPIGKTPIFF